jgi:hypothetical protein
MMGYLSPHHLIVYGGTALGTLAGVFIFDVEPAVMGWLFGAGAGMAGGAFVAAVSTGDTLASGPSRARRASGRSLPRWDEDHRNGH